MRLHLFLSSAMIDLDNLVEKSWKVYFPIGGYSSADFITVHAALLSIIRGASESDLRQLHMSTSDARERISLCQRNIGIALEQSSLFLQPCMDNIVALMLGVSQKMRPSDPLILR